MNGNALSCNQIHCDNILHYTFIDKMCDKLIQCCITAGSEAFPCKKGPSKHRNIPLWNVEIEPYHEKSLFWNNIWVDSNRPKNGIVFDIMKQSRAQYHYAVRRVKRSEANHRIELFLLNTKSYNAKQFWSSVKGFGDTGNNVSATVVDG